MRVGVVGLGRMGAALVRRLLKHGIGVTVWNRSPATVEALVAEGAVAAEVLAEVWDHAEAVFSFLADDTAAGRRASRPHPGWSPARQRAACSSK